jgi:hypothetical protein
VGNDRLIHDAAFALSRGILSVFAPCLREEEQREAFREVYERVKAGIERFEIESDRMAQRLRPGGISACGESR